MGAIRFFPSWAFAGFVSFAILMTAAAATSPAQDLSALEPPAAFAEQPNLLVLDTWEVVQGEIDPQVGGYMVKVPYGEVLVTYDRVRTAATTLADAYARLRDNTPQPNANQRIELGYWCTRVGLWEEARVEILAALRLEPTRAEARQLLQMIELVRLQGQADEPQAAGTAARRQSIERLAQTGAGGTSVHGLSETSVASYVREVQPLLVNSCASAACHGARGTSPLRLHSVATGRRIQRFASDENLAMVLGYIDREHPARSPLLTVPQSGDAAHRAVFRGPRAADQRELLTAWVERVAAELPGGDATSESPFARAVDVTQSSGNATGNMPRGDAAPAPGSVIPAAAMAPWEGATENDEALAERILREERVDPFDPDEFNRLIHGIEVFGVPVADPTDTPRSE